RRHRFLDGSLYNYGGRDPPALREYRAPADIAGKRTVGADWERASEPLPENRVAHRNVYRHRRHRPSGAEGRRIIAAELQCESKDGNTLISQAPHACARTPAWRSPSKDHWAAVAHS